MADQIGSTAIGRESPSDRICRLVLDVSQAVRIGIVVVRPTPYGQDDGHRGFGGLARASDECPDGLMADAQLAEFLLGYDRRTVVERLPFDACCHGGLHLLVVACHYCTTKGCLLSITLRPSCLGH